jgi:signal peptidase I
MEPHVPARTLSVQTEPAVSGPDVAFDPSAPIEPEGVASARTRPRSRAREYAEAILVAVIFALFARTFLFQAFQVPTSSMEKTVLVGDHLLVNKFIFAPHKEGFLSRLLPYRHVRRGDVIVFKFPDDPRRDFIKRTVALPGETVEIRDKVVYIEGSPLEEPRAYHSDERVWADEPEVPESYRRRDQARPFTVPPDSYFALGDNRDESSDSRFWGPVPASYLKGRALFVYWSFPLEPSAHRSVRELLSIALNFFRRTRWDRTLLPVR